MKNIIKLFIFVPILLTLIIPVVSFAQHRTYEAARAAAQNVPDCAPNATDRSRCCAQSSEIGPDGKRKGLVQCGRKIKCEYEVKVDKKNTLVSGDDVYIVNQEVILRTIDKDDLCDYNDMMELVNNIINFILFYMAIPIAGIMFTYAGFTLVTAGADNSGARTKAKSIFFKAAIGLAVAFVAYLIVVFLLKALGYDGSWIFNTF